MRFKYTATNTEGKTLTGIINAETEEEAREKLNHLGFSILEINAAPETEGTAAQNLEKFEFEATDKNGKKIKGSIPAKDREAAYKRLIEEYSFTIQYLAPANATEGEKTRYRLEGVDALTEGATPQDTKGDEAMQEVVETPEFVAEKESLIAHVDGIIEKIHNLLSTFEGKISPEKRALIENDIDKLLRIKSSNNLDYIRHTCKELLEKTQEEEVFLTNQTHEDERNTMVLESQKLMMELNKASGAKTNVGLQMKSSLSALEEKLTGGKFEFLLEPVRNLQNMFTPDPETLKIKTQLKSLRSQEWTALKVAIKSPKDTRPAALQNLKDLRNQEKAIRAKLHAIKQLRHENNLMIRKEREIYFIEEISTFTGALLAFYIIYYFLGHYVTTTSLEMDPILGVPFDLSKSVLYKYLLAIIFLIHASTSVKLNFFIRSKIATITFGTITLALSLMVLFNF